MLEIILIELMEFFLVCNIDHVIFLFLGPI